jgi:ParB/RepB/Spo0J family partition protein
MSQTVTLAVEQLHPNEYNPNVMTEAESAEFAAEVRHLGRIPKPVVVRPNGVDYVIVDGEHGWRAAIEAGLKEIPCEIIEADEFEAMRQTYKRNQHGTHDPVRLGKMFKQMMESRGLSQRAFAKEIAVSEGTIRNALAYCEAAEMRNSYAPDTAASDVANLSVRQLQKYLSYPDGIRDKWLDAGANSVHLTGITVTLRDEYGRRHKQAVDASFAFRQIATVGLSSNLDSQSAAHFNQSVQDLYPMARWAVEYNGYIPESYEYARAVASVSPSVNWLNRMPCDSDSEELTVKLYFTPEEWKEILSYCASRGESKDKMWPFIEARMNLLLKQKGIDRDGYDYTDPRVALVLDELRDAPDFIRNAPIDLVEKHYLHTVESTDPSISEELFLEFKREAVKTLIWKNEFLATAGDHAEHEEAIKANLSTLTAEEALRRTINRGLFDKGIEDRNALFDDRERLLDAAVDSQRKYYDIREGVIDGRKAVDVFRERLAALPYPEFRMLAAYLTGHSEIVPGTWFQALGGKDPRFLDQSSERETSASPAEANSPQEEKRLDELEAVIANGLGV